MPSMNYPDSQFLLIPAVCLLLLFPFLHCSPLSDGNRDNPTSDLSFSSKSHAIRRPSVEVDGSSSRHNAIRKKSSLERIERDLAQARAAIRKAIQSRNYTSDREETFVPKGKVYRNAYAFHQSHIEMRKRFKVWTYREGDLPLVHNGPMSHIYSIEGQIINEMEDPRNPFRAHRLEEAHAFFLPFSVANIIHYVYEPIVPMDEDWRARLQRIVADYIGVVADRYGYWNRSGGADHFMVACHDWGPAISSADRELYKNFIRVLCNANTSEEFRPQIDASMPGIFVNYVHLRPPRSGLDASKRNILAFFAGGAHGFIRELLLEHWKDKDNDVQVHEYLPKGQDYHKLMGKSKFCLCPSGYEVGTPRISESMYAGCVPVIIKEHYALPFSDVLDWSKFSVHIPVQSIKDIKTILQAIPYEKFVKMQRRVVKVSRHFELHRPAKPYDVIHMVLHSVWLRRLNFKLEQID